MKHTFGRVCAIAREESGLRQESASELLHVSTRSISDYERNITIPPQDIVLAMMKHYNAPWLGYMYLQLTNEVGRAVLPELELRQLSASILDLQVGIMEASEMHKQIAKVGRDDVIDNSEQPIWCECTNAIKSLAGAAFSVIFAPMHKEKTAHKRAAT